MAELTKSSQPETVPPQETPLAKVVKQRNLNKIGFLNSKTLIIALSILLFASFALTGYLVYQNRKLTSQLLQLQSQSGAIQNQELPSPKEEEMATTTLSDLPELFPGPNWKTVPPEEPFLSGYPAFYYNNWGVVENTAEGKEESIKVGGQEWVSQTDKYSFSDFYEYYESALLKLGWSQSLTLENYRITIQAMSADGPTGSVWGYIGLENDKVQAVVFSYDKSGEIPEFRVFISKIVSLNEILPK